MSNFIQLLPDHIANQIAAGEVIQRPASVVKELLENAVDAGAQKIQLIVKEAGKALIQVVDDGKGMSETDARLCFERHATSKIREAADLFQLHTNGFRGEALASIASIAHVELKTKTEEDPVGQHIIIEGSSVLNHEPTSMNTGSNFMIKNLFYNVPARRNFLKADRTEFRFIQEEFFHIALANPSISLSLHHNDKELFRLPGSSFRQRIVNLYGKRYNPRLVPIEEETDIVTISGFIAKPEFAKKSRGEQFFFVNNRFIKNHYLHHAILTALENLIQDGLHPSYFIFINVPPESIDVNIHPTKTEIKFENEKFIYAILKSCIKKSLGQYNIAPSIDFDTNQDYDVAPMMSASDSVNFDPSVTVNPNFNPFDLDNEQKKDLFPKPKDQSFSTRMRQATGVNQYSDKEERQTEEDWRSFMEIESVATTSEHETDPGLFESEGLEQKTRPVHQIHQKYILSPVKSGFILIHQNRAHERILFEQFKKSLSDSNSLCQQLLFPQTIELSKEDLLIFKDVQSDIERLGFDFGEFSDEGIEVHGIPFDTQSSDIQLILEKVLDDFKHFEPSHEDKSEQVARSLAKSMSIKTGKNLKIEEMNHLIDQLFACESPFLDPNGKKTHININLDEIDSKFN